MGTDGNFAPADLRFSIVPSVTSDPGFDLDSFDAEQYPDGCMVFCVSNGTLYKLSKASALTADGAAIVTCASGGRWLAVVSNDAALYTCQVYLDVSTSEPLTGALVQDTWTALPSSASQYAATGSALFSVSTSTGVITYNGPTRSFLVLGQFSTAPASGTTTPFEFSFSRSSAAIIGGTTTPDYSAKEEWAAVEARSVSFQGYLATLAATQTVQGCLRNVTGTEGTQILRYQLTLLPVG